MSTQVAEALAWYEPMVEDTVPLQTSPLAPNDWSQGDTNYIGQWGGPHVITDSNDIGSCLQAPDHIPTVIDEVRLPLTGTSNSSNNGLWSHHSSSSRSSRSNEPSLKTNDAGLKLSPCLDAVCRIWRLHNPIGPTRRVILLLSKLFGDEPNAILSSLSILYSKPETFDINDGSFDLGADNEEAKEELIASSIYGLWLYQSKSPNSPTDEEMKWLSGLFRLGEPSTRFWFERIATSSTFCAKRGVRDRDVVPDSYRRNLGKCLQRSMVEQRIQGADIRSRDPGKPYVCTTGCGKMFKKKGDWIKHEKLNWPQEIWICCHAGCFEKTIERRIFTRRDNFKEHVNTQHNLQDETTVDICERKIISQFEPCIFCEKVFDNWDRRITHLAWEFERTRPDFDEKDSSCSRNEPNDTDSNEDGSHRSSYDRTPRNRGYPPIYNQSGRVNQLERRAPGASNKRHRGASSGAAVESQSDVTNGTHSENVIRAQDQGKDQSSSHHTSYPHRAKEYAMASHSVENISQLQSHPVYLLPDTRAVHDPTLGDMNDVINHSLDSREALVERRGKANEVFRINYKTASNSSNRRIGKPIVNPASREIYGWKGSDDSTFVSDPVSDPISDDVFDRLDDETVLTAVSSITSVMGDPPKNSSRLHRNALSRISDEGKLRTDRRRSPPAQLKSDDLDGNGFVISVKPPHTVSTSFHRFEKERNSNFHPDSLASSSHLYNNQPSRLTLSNVTSRGMESRDRSHMVDIDQHRELEKLECVIAQEMEIKSRRNYLDRLQQERFEKERLDEEWRWEAEQEQRNQQRFDRERDKKLAQIERRLEDLSIEERRDRETNPPLRSIDRDHPPTTGGYFDNPDQLPRSKSSKHKPRKQLLW